MSAATKVYISVGLGSALALFVLWLQPRVERALAPEPHTAHVAVQVAGSATAVVGPVETRAGTGFRLHAVLEATTRSGEPVYYSEATSLQIGGKVVPADRVRRWDRPQAVKILWFTVESRATFAQLDGEDALDDLRFVEFFHPEWSTSWQIAGRLDSRHAEPLAGLEERVAGFGTQRYRAWVEVYAEKNSLVPETRYQSLGADDLPELVSEFPAMTASLDGPAAAATAVFGLIGLELPEDASVELRTEVGRHARSRLLFTRLSVLREILALVGSDLEQLPWLNIELDGSMEWSVQVRQGDLLRVGARLVMLHEDRDGDGRLGAGDSCLDFEQEAAVRRLDEVFLGEGEIEWASLTT